MGEPPGDGNALNQLSSPVAACYNSLTQEVAIADTGNQRISIFQNFKGNANRTITHQMLISPISVAFHPVNSQLYVVDSYNMTILVFNSENGIFFPSLIVLGELIATTFSDSPPVSWVTFAPNGTMYVVTDTGFQAYSEESPNSWKVISSYSRSNAPGSGVTSIYASELFVYVADSEGVSVFWGKTGENTQNIVFDSVTANFSVSGVFVNATEDIFFLGSSNLTIISYGHKDISINVLLIAVLPGLGGLVIIASVVIIYILVTFDVCYSKSVLRAPRQNKNLGVQQIQRKQSSVIKRTNTITKMF